MNEFRIRLLNAKDLDGPWHSWGNSPEINEFTSRGYFPNYLENQRDYYNKLLTSKTDVVFALESQESEHFGNVGVHQIDFMHGTAILGIVIGEAYYQGKGFGKMAWKFITDYGFNTLGLRKITCTIMECNRPSQKCAEGNGYKMEGIQVKQVWKNGAYRDLYYYGKLKDIG